MTKIFKAVIAAVLIIALSTQSTFLVFASSDDIYSDRIIASNEDEKKAVIYSLFHPNYCNYEEFNAEEKYIIDNSILHLDKYLQFAGMYNGHIVAIFYTDKDNTIIGITDGYVEIIEYLDENSICINNETVHFSVDVEKSPSLHSNTYKSETKGTREPTGWVEVSSLSNAVFTQLDDYNWYNVHLQNAIANFTIAALSIILGAAAHLPWYGSVLAGIASYLLASAYTNTSTAAVSVYTYLDTVTADPLMWYRKDKCYGYAYSTYDDTYVYLGYENKYYILNLV